MRLLNTRTLKLAEFWDNAVPIYAILSHTWEKDEITLQELECPQKGTFVKQGYLKIKQCAELARKEGYEWVWIDTCCIDKSSSAELSEAINSMFKWYRRARMCYAYFFDCHEARLRGELPGSFAKSR